MNALKAEGKEVRLQYSYTEKGDGHRFVVEKKEGGEETILDPTYLQYDKNYPEGFVGQSFPDQKLEKKRIELKKKTLWSSRKNDTKKECMISFSLKNKLVFPSKIAIKEELYQ